MINVNFTKYKTDLDNVIRIVSVGNLVLFALDLADLTAN